MKLLDITLAVANDPNTLFEVKNHNGYYRITGFGERRVYGSRGKTLKTVSAVRVYFKSAVSEHTDYNGELVPAQPHHISEGTFVESFLPSQVENIAQRWDEETDGAITLTVDNLLAFKIRETERANERKAEDERKVQGQLEALNAFLGDSFEVKAHHLTDSYWSRYALEAIATKLQESAVNT